MVGAARLISAIFLVSLYSALPGSVSAQEKFITLASTTSTENSGLFRYLLPAFTDETGISVRVVAVGTGQAIRLAERGDADVLLVHHEPSEQRLVKIGAATSRHDVMYNDFVIVGPSEDPARIRGFNVARQALSRIADGRHIFASRGDDSGTHKAELAIWTGTGVDLKAASGAWYRETGSGMGATLNVSSALPAYTLTDRATWVSFKNKGTLTVLVSGDPALFNQYGVLRMSKSRHPHLKHVAANRFIDWLLSSAGQSRIASFRVAGQQLFIPNGRAVGGAN